MWCLGLDPTRPWQDHCLSSPGVGQGLLGCVVVCGSGGHSCTPLGGSLCAVTAERPGKGHSVPWVLALGTAGLFEPAPTVPGIMVIDHSQALHQSWGVIKA